MYRGEECKLLHQHGKISKAGIQVACSSVIDIASQVFRVILQTLLYHMYAMSFDPVYLRSLCRRYGLESIGTGHSEEEYRYDNYSAYDNVAITESELHHVYSVVDTRE